MNGYEWKRNASGDLVRVASERGQRVVDLAAGQVRGSSWQVETRPVRGRRSTSYNDTYHQGATGTGRTLSKNTRSV